MLILLCVSAEFRYRLRRLEPTGIIDYGQARRDAGGVDPDRSVHF